MAEKGDSGLGGAFGLGGLLRGIGDLLHQAADMSADRGPPGAKGQRPTVESRMSVRTVDGKEIGTDFFGPVDFASGAAARPKEATTSPPPDRRDPQIDVFATADALSAIVELPGAEPETLVVRVEHDMLIITASGCGVEYAAEALLPAPVADGAREQSFRNGVLELRWPLADRKV